MERLFKQEIIFNGPPERVEQRKVKELEDKSIGMWSWRDLEEGAGTQAEDGAKINWSHDVARCYLGLEELQRVGAEARICVLCEKGFSS